MAKSSAIPYSFREGGLKGSLTHLASVFLGDAKFNRSASTVDMRRANLQIRTSARGLLAEAFPETSLKKIELMVKEAERKIEELQKTSHRKLTFPDHWDSGWELQKFLYCSIRITKPKIVVETGTANGKSTAAICAALAKNKVGHVWSFDVLESNAPYVSDNHRGYLTLIRTDGRSSTLMDRLNDITSTEGFKIFFHDSDHSFPNQYSDYLIASKKRFDLLISDDIDASLAFCDFAKSLGFAVLDSNKFFGFLANPHLAGKR